MIFLILSCCRMERLVEHTVPTSGRSLTPSGCCFMHLPCHGGAGISLSGSRAAEPRLSVAPRNPLTSHDSLAPSKNPAFSEQDVYVGASRMPLASYTTGTQAINNKRPICALTTATCPSALLLHVTGRRCKLSRRRKCCRDMLRVHVDVLIDLRTTQQKKTVENSVPLTPVYDDVLLQCLVWILQ